MIGEGLEGIRTIGDHLDVVLLGRARVRVAPEDIIALTVMQSNHLLYEAPASIIRSISIARLFDCSNCLIDSTMVAQAASFFHRQSKQCKTPAAAAEEVAVAIYTKECMGSGGVAELVASLHGLEVHVVGRVDGRWLAVHQVRHGDTSAESRVIFDIVNPGQRYSSSDEPFVVCTMADDR